MRVILLFVVVFSLLPFHAAIGSPSTKKAPQTTASSKKVTQPTSVPSTSYAYWNLVAAFVGDSTKNTKPFNVGNRWSISWDTNPGANGDGNFAIEIHRVKDDAVVGTAANVIGRSKDETQEYQAGEFYLSITAGQKYTIIILELYDPIKFVQENGPSALHNGNFPLVEAAGVSRDTSGVRMLLSKGTAIDGKGRDGQTALMVASKCGHYDMVKLLLSRGADINATDNNGVDALMSAAEGSDADCINVVQLLISKGADVNMSDKNSGTALSKAVFLNPHANIVKALLDGGADVNKTDKNGFTALDWTIHSATTNKEAPEVIKLLKAAGAKSNETDSDGNHY